MRREELCIADPVDNARVVREYPDGVTRGRWDTDRVLRYAVLYRMLLLGEIASTLSEGLRHRCPAVAWRRIRAFRNLASAGNDVGKYLPERKANGTFQLGK